MAVRTIALIHHVHTDFGYTDHPQRAKAEHIRYIDQAVDGVLASADYPEGSRFAWTQEQLWPVRRWWEQASADRKERFFAAVDSGRLEITGTPFNVTALMSAEEWDAAMHWIPDSLWDRCRIRSAVQIDVNGMHTGGMIRAHRRGVRNLFIGPNTYYGVPPMPTPAAFLWQLDEERRMFVWLNASYNNGYFLFQDNWRQGPVPDYADLRYRPPERGDIWRSDDASLLEAHRRCLAALAEIEGTSEDPGAQSRTDGFTKNRVFGGYALEVLPVSVTSQWRVDNDPPFYPIVDFVRRWNELGLKPRLKLCTVSQAMDMVKAEMNEKIPVYRGEWADWWANGSASSPVELAFKREALRTLRAAESPLFGPMKDGQRGTAREILENACLYDEHSFGSWQSVSAPYSFASLSQTAEKSIYAYRALDAARCLLADRARETTAARNRNAIYIWNPAKTAVTAAIRLPLNCMRGDYRSVRCEETGVVYPLEAEDGAANFLRPSDPSEFGPENVSRTFSDKSEKQGVRFGPVTVPAMSGLCLIPGTEAALPPAVPEKEYTLETDSDGWPVRLRFLCQSAPVIDGPFGDFLAVQADGFAPRWTFRDIFENDDAEERAALREAHLCEIPAKAEKAERADRPGQIVFTQPFSHGSLRYGVRELTVDLVNARVSLEVRIDRRSDFTPEVLMLRFDAPAPDILPTVSNAGVRFRPEKDQLPGSCMDFYAVDGWARYDNGWLISCRDSALIGFGAHGVVARQTSTDGPANRIFARVFDNTWDTNFRANACGRMRFCFSASAGVPDEDAESAAESMDTEPVVQVKTGYRD